MQIAMQEAYFPQPIDMGCLPETQKLSTVRANSDYIPTVTLLHIPHHSVPT